MDTLIKWPGGKSEEVDRIKEFVPSEYDRYIEPFFGGGAVFWELKPDRAVLNDISSELMDFYRYIGGKRDRAEFKSHMYEYVEHWELLSSIVEEIQDDILSTYFKYSRNNISRVEFEKEIKEILEKNGEVFEQIDEEFSVDRDALLATIEERLTSKLVRTSDKVDEGNDFPKSDVLKNVETGIRSGFYTHFRSILNQAKLGRIELRRSKEIANYFFIREFCYGSMFRYNSDGEFNIPYGGIAYNGKDIRKKVDRIFSPDVNDLLSRAELYSDDFETVLTKCAPTEDDFIFFDPPYDTAFSGYNGIAFGDDDHQRLADWIKSSSAKFILVIQNTEMIQSLYGNTEGINIESFDKQYSYNVRDRNERDVEHLIIHNLKREQKTLVNYTEDAGE